MTQILMRLLQFMRAVLYQEPPPRVLEIAECGGGWMTAAMGVCLLLHISLLDYPIVRAMQDIAPRAVWGWSHVLIALLSFFAIGTRRRRLRRVTALLSGWLWFFAWVAAWQYVAVLSAATLPGLWGAFFWVAWRLSGSPGGQQRWQQNRDGLPPPSQP